MKTKIWQIVQLLFSILLTVSCSNSDKSQGISPIAEKFLNEILDIMEENSVYRNNIDWISLRKEVFEIASDAQNKKDAYEAIRKALVLLNDNHSYKSMF